MPPRKRPRPAKRLTTEETQPIVEADPDTPVRRGDRTPTSRARDAKRWEEAESSSKRLSSSSSAAANVAGLSRSTRRLAAALLAQNPPTLVQSDVLGALSFSEESEKDSASDDGDVHTKDRRARDGSPERRTTGPDDGLGGDSPATHLTSGRHTISLSKTMKQFVATPHHLAATSPFIGRPFKPPSSTVRNASARANHVEATTPAAPAAVAAAPAGADTTIVPFIDTQVADPHEAPPAQAAARAKAPPHARKPVAPLQSSPSVTPHSSHPAPAFTDGTERELLSDSEDIVGVEESGDHRHHSTHEVLPRNDKPASTPRGEEEEVLAASLQCSPAAQSAHQRGRSAGTGNVPTAAGTQHYHHLNSRAVTLLGDEESPLADEDRGSDVEDEAQRGANDPGEADPGLAAGGVLLDSLGRPGHPGLTPQDESGRPRSAHDAGADAHACGAAENAALSSANSTPRLMVTPQPPGSHLLGGGSVGKLSPLSVPPLVTSTYTLGANTDDYAQTLAVQDLSLRSAAPAERLESLAPEEERVAKELSDGSAAEGLQGPETTPRAAEALPETVDDGCFKPDLAHEEEGPEATTSSGSVDKGTHAVLGAGEGGGFPRRDTEANHAALVAAAAARQASRTAAGAQGATADPFLAQSPTPIERKGTLSPRRHKASAAPEKSSSTTSPRAPLTVGTVVEARWGRNWYPAVVSEKERSGYVQIRWTDGDEDAVLHLRVREVRLPRAAKSSATAAASASANHEKRRRDEPATDTTVTSSSGAGTAGVPAEGLSASQVAELIALEVLSIDDRGTDSAVSNRKRPRGATDDSDGAKMSRGEGNERGLHTRQDVKHDAQTRVDTSHLLLFDAHRALAATSTAPHAESRPQVPGGTHVGNFDAFLHVVAYVADQYRVGDTGDERTSHTTPGAHGVRLLPTPPPLCLYLVDVPESPQATSVANAEVTVDKTSPAASWEVLIAHALGLSAVRASWLLHTGVDLTRDTTCTIPDDSELLHLLRPPSSLRPSTADVPTEGARSVDRLPGGLVPWHVSARFLYGVRVLMPHTARLDDSDRMVRLIRAAGGVPISLASWTANSCGDDDAAAPLARASPDYIYLTPGADTGLAHDTLLSAEPSLKGVPLLELPWLVKNIEALFAKHLQTVQHWWLRQLPQYTAQETTSSRTSGWAVPWSLPRKPPLATLIALASKDDAERRDHVSAAVAATEMREAGEGSTTGKVAPAKTEGLSLPRPPPLAVNESTTPGRAVARGAHGRSAPGGISPTTIAAIKSRGKRVDETTPKATTYRSTATVAEVEEDTLTDHPGPNSSARRVLSYAMKEGTRAQDDGDLPYRGGSSPLITAECVAHPPVNEGEDYYYRVAVPPSAQSRLGVTDALVAHDLGLGRVASVEHRVVRTDNSSRSADLTTCMAHLQLYTVRRVVMRQNPITGDLEQQTTLALTRRYVTVPTSALLFEVPVYVVDAASLRHVYVLDEEVEEHVTSDAEVDRALSAENSSRGHLRHQAAGSHAPLTGTTAISPPRPTVRLDSANGPAHPLSRS